MKPKKHRKSGTSKTSQVLAPYFDSLPLDEFSLESCPSKGTCSLAPGIEHLFVFQTALAALEELKTTMQEIAPSQVVYMPHSRSEKGGFDLSLGTIESGKRVLSMHKLRKHSWCDSSWSWKSSSDRTSHGQIIKLVNHYAKRDHLPFLALHTCYCVHEYRRMGCRVNGVEVPRFSAHIRSVFVDLRPIRRLKDWDNRLRSRQVHVEVNHQPSDGLVRSALVSSKDSKRLVGLNSAGLSDFLVVLANHLTT